MMEPLYLSRLYLNLRCREVRRDVSDCMGMHRTLMAAFPDRLSEDGAARAKAGVLFRVETDDKGRVAVFVQSTLPPDWTRMPPIYFSPDAAPETKSIGAALSRLAPGAVLRFRLLANPTRKIGTKSGPDGRKNNGKRVELRGEEAWIGWLQRKSEQHGFRLRGVRIAPHTPAVQSSPEVKSVGFKKRPEGEGARLTFGGVTFEGHLEITDAGLFAESLRRGIGPGKAFGFGLLSIGPGGTSGGD